MDILTKPLSANWFNYLKPKLIVVAHTSINFKGVQDKQFFQFICLERSLIFFINESPNFRMRFLFEGVTCKEYKFF
jgi:hypothetical protein